jgi:hypothetical protein
LLVENNIRKFINEASDEELAYYGFGTVLEAKQKRLTREEEGKQNEASRDYMKKTGEAAVKSSALTDAQIKVQLAQAAKYAAEEKLTLSKIGQMGFQDDDLLKDLLKERMTTIKTEDDYVNALNNDPNFRLLMDTVAKRSGLPGWHAVQKTPGLWEMLTKKVNDVLHGQSSFTTAPVGQPASTGPQYDSPDDANAVMQKMNTLFN